MWKFREDASGNMMASYKYGKKTSTGKDTLYTDNFIMYGSSRIGTKNAIHYDMKNAAVVKAKIIAEQSGFATLGDKQYEFSDHLGNVHMTISDRNKRHCDGNGDWEYNDPDILTSTDYYPGGYQMPERKWNDNSITYWNAQLGLDTVVGYFEDFSTAVKEVIATSPIDIFVNQYGGPTHNSMLYIEPSPTLGQQRVRVQSTSCTLGLWGVINVTPGVPVTIKYNVDIGTAGKINFLHGASGSTVAYTGKQTSVSGWDSVTITPTGPTLYFQLRANNCTNTYFYVNSISVRQGTTMRYISAFNSTPLSLQLANDWQNMSGTESGNYYASNIDVETYTGGKRVKVTVLTNIGNYGILNNVPMTVIPGKQYTFRFKVDKGNFSHINFMYGQKNPADAGYTWSGYVYTAYSNGWHEYTFTPTKTQMMVQIRPGTNGQGKYFYLEAVELLYKDGTIHYSLEQDTARYQFGFNGQLKDNEIYGDGNAYAFEYRIQDPRLVRFLSVDPLRREYPWNSPYAFAENDIIRCIDLEGLEKIIVVGADKTNFWGETFLVMQSSDRLSSLYREISKPDRYDKQLIIFKIENLPFNQYGEQYMGITASNLKLAAKEYIAYEKFIETPEFKRLSYDEQGSIHDNGWLHKQTLMGARIFEYKELIANSPQEEVFAVILHKPMVEKSKIFQQKSLAHEVRQHLLNALNHINLPASVEHLENYGITPGTSEFKKHQIRNEIDVAPPYNEVNPSSPSGQDFKEIDKYYENKK